MHKCMQKLKVVTANELNIAAVHIYTLIKLSCLDVRSEIDRISGVSFNVAALRSVERLVTAKRHAERSDAEDER